MGKEQVEDSPRYVVELFLHYLPYWILIDQAYIGGAIKNFDLFWHLLDIHDRLLELGGTIEYVLIPREQNREADALANLGCDQAEEHYSNGYSHDYP